MNLLDVEPWELLQLCFRFFHLPSQNDGSMHTVEVLPETNESVTIKHLKECLTPSELSTYMC